MRKLMLLATLSAMVVLAFAPVAVAQSFHEPNAPVGSTCPPGDATFGDIASGLTCYTPQDFATLQSGICANSPTPQAAIDCLNARKAAQAQPMTTAAAPATTPQTTTAAPASTTMTTLPNTGGPQVLLPIAGLILGAGLLGAGILRRR